MQVITSDIVSPKNIERRINNPAVDEVYRCLKRDACGQGDAKHRCRAKAAGFRKGAWAFETSTQPPRLQHSQPSRTISRHYLLLISQNQRHCINCGPSHPVSCEPKSASSSAEQLSLIRGFTRFEPYWCLCDLRPRMQHLIGPVGSYS